MLQLSAPPPWWWSASLTLCDDRGSEPVPDPWWAAGLCLLCCDDRFHCCIMRGGRTRSPCVRRKVLPRTDLMAGSEPSPRPLVGRGTVPAAVIANPGASHRCPPGGAVGAAYVRTGAAPAWCWHSSKLNGLIRTMIILCEPHGC